MGAGQRIFAVMKVFAWEGKQPRFVVCFAAETNRRSAASDEGPVDLFYFTCVVVTDTEDLAIFRDVS